MTMPQPLYTSSYVPVQPGFNIALQSSTNPSIPPPILKRLLWNDPRYDFAAYPGPMFRAVVTHVKEENCAGLVYMVQHSVFDGISLEFFLQDLDALLVANNNTATTSSSSSLPQRVPFRA